MLPVNPSIFGSKCDENSEDTLEIPLEFGLRKRAGLDDWWFGPRVNALYINFVQP